MTPKTFLVGYTEIDKGLLDYLKYTGNEDFASEVREACSQGLCPGQVLCSFYAKLCYRSLRLGTNANVTKIRGIEENLKGVFKSGHGSVFEHCNLNFVTTDCSRVFTHELVRHRVGTAFSQTSGRYCAIDKLDMVDPPELEDDVEEHKCPRCFGTGFWGHERCDACEGDGTITVADYCKFLDKETTNGLVGLREMLIKDGMDFNLKKRYTSAIRRRAPNGQTNEIGWSCNIRSLRHLIELRTSRHAEWEIRYVFNQVATIIQGRWPAILYGGEAVSTGDGLHEYTGLKI